MIAYHGARLTKSAKFVEEEQWTQIDVGPSLQHTVNLLISAATEDPAECFVPPRSDDRTNSNGDASAAPTKQLSIEDNSYYIVKATGETLSLLSDYLKIVINLELVVMDVMSRIIEFLKVSPVPFPGHYEMEGGPNIPVIQLANLPGRSRCRCDEIRWSQEYYSKAPR